MTDTNTLVAIVREFIDGSELVRDYGAAQAALNNLEERVDGFRNEAEEHQARWLEERDRRTSLEEQLEAAQRDLANTVYERDMHVRVGMEAERHLRGIAEAYDAARVDESARVMYDIARSSVPQRDDQGHILDPEWAERMIERWMPSNPAISLDLTLCCPECGRRADVCFDHGDDWKKRSASVPAISPEASVNSPSGTRVRVVAATHIRSSSSS